MNKLPDSMDQVAWDTQVTHAIIDIHGGTTPMLDEAAIRAVVARYPDDPDVRSLAIEVLAMRVNYDSACGHKYAQEIVRRCMGVLTEHEALPGGPVVITAAERLRRDLGPSSPGWPKGTAVAWDNLTVVAATDTPEPILGSTKISIVTASPIVRNELGQMWVVRDVTCDVPEPNILIEPAELTARIQDGTFADLPAWRARQDHLVLFVAPSFRYLCRLLSVEMPMAAEEDVMMSGESIYYVSRRKFVAWRQHAEGVLVDHSDRLLVASSHVMARGDRRERVQKALAALRDTAARGDTR